MALRPEDFCALFVVFVLQPLDVTDWHPNAYWPLFKKPDILSQVLLPDAYTEKFWVLSCFDNSLGGGIVKVKNLSKLKDKKHQQKKT